MDDAARGYARHMAAGLLGELPPQPDRRQILAQHLMGLLPQTQQMNYAQSFDPAVRNWRTGFEQRFGEPPALNDPGYNYSLAYGAGARPEPYAHDNGAYHWPSSVAVAPLGDVSLKSANHPTAWMETFMRTHGVDPNEAPPGLLVAEYLRGNIPRNGWGR